MKLAVSIYNLKQLNKFAKFMDCAILNVPEYSLVYEDLDLNKALAFCRSHSITPIIAVNKLLHPYDIPSIRSFIIQYMAKDVLFLFTDLGAANLAIELNIINQVIFDPQTMITNPLDLMEYASIGFHSVSMSLEIPWEDVVESIDQTNGNVFYQIFGHRLMFYSKRKLVSLYEEKSNIHTSKKGLYLKEATRQDYLPIIENKNGTMIYRSYMVSLLSLDLSKLSYGYLESLYVEEDSFLKVLEIYYQVFHHVITKEEGLQKIKSLSLDIQDGFTYCDSVYQKELF